MLVPTLQNIVNFYAKPVYYIYRQIDTLSYIKYAREKRNLN